MSETLPELPILRGYELRLLRCTLQSPASDPSPYPQPSDHAHPTHHLHPLINDLLTSIESGHYLQALTSPDVNRVVFKLAQSDSLGDSAECADRVYSELLDRVESFISKECEEEENDSGKDKAYRVIVVLCIAVAAFFGFAQCNLTGPLEGLPKCPLPLEVPQCDEWENWARNQLMAAGSDLLGKLSNIQYIVYAKMLAMKMKDLLFDRSVPSTYGIRSISWWLIRITLLHQRVLDDRSSSLFNLLQVFTSETLNHFGTLEKVTTYWGNNLRNGEGSSLVSMIYLEAGIMEYTYARVDSCRLHFESAEAAAGLQLSVTGVLGFRTVHQVEPKAQMVLLANPTSSNSSGSCLAESPGSQTNNSSIDNLHPSETYEASDILMTPKLLGNDSNSGIISEGIQVGGTAAVPLSAVHQAVILAKCLLIEKGTRHDEMQRWEMAPYIEAINSQQSSYFIIRYFCDILRIRWESTRSHTKERALMMMEKLVQGIYDPSPGVAERILFCYGVQIPTIPALRKEYGELLVGCGLIGEAVKTFEDLELWDNLIFCYRLLQKKAAAVELIKTRLSETPNDPRLWCSLGDVTNDDACFEKALEVSNDRSARAKRSLARSAYNRGDYEKSKTLWESAMASNSLYPDGWFALGAAALKARDTEKALDAFTRAVQLDPENGEAWNNIACLHMIKKKSKESFIAFREALKFKRNSWQLWENYSHVAVDVGNVGQGLEAARMVLDITNNKRIDAELLERIVAEVEIRASHTTPDMTDEDKCSTEVGQSRETEHLVEFLGKVLQQIVRSGNGADIWGLYARWHKMKGDLTMCSEALLKQVRSYQGSDLWKDRDRFKKFAQSSLELCKVYMEISASAGSRRELLTAEMHLKNTIKQAVSFSDMEELQDLQACLHQVKSKLESDSLCV
ncbi:PREDICTED: tetratricopeptide repeat [Prunus dulcis]|uniref:PREDICTED: tetratricopeptide repeat n=1 Tax=Prunus dulcis TaxID=3755 RepID=A0A5E4FMP0_PRUDU|nr:tetratricopeptide repeat protein 27 homolog isoform X1 [Prunus dulcis]VVA28890.1 PREDICTED: tetratricopeptide repeat [Prunus dulcis]